MQTIGMTTELQVLAWSVVLLFVHVFSQAFTTTAKVGLSYGAGARDEQKDPGVVPSRLKRALVNYNETYIGFVALALALAVTGKSGDIAATGAVLWIVSRVVYLPLYALGIPYVRTVAFFASVIGLLMMLARLIG